MSKDEILTQHFVEDAKKVIEIAKKCRGIKGITFHMNKNIDSFNASIDLNEKHNASCELSNNGTDTITIKW